MSSNTSAVGNTVKIAQNSKNRLLCNLASQLLGICVRKMKLLCRIDAYTTIVSMVLFIAATLWNQPMYIDKSCSYNCMDKEDNMCTHRVLFSHKAQQNHVVNSKSERTRSHHIQVFCPKWKLKAEKSELNVEEDRLRSSKREMRVKRKQKMVKKMGISW